MERRERFNNFSEAILAALPSFQAGIWTALPAIVYSFNATDMTIVARPALQVQVKDEDGNRSWVSLPPLHDVPVCFPGGGGYTLTFPIAQGDEALIVFASRCIDAWWQSGGVQVQAELRMHDLSDGFAIVGPRAKARALANISTTTTQLRSDDGESYVEMAGGHVVNVVAPGGINLTTDGEIKMTAGTRVTVDSPLLRAEFDIVDRYPINSHSMGSAFQHIQEIYDEHVHHNVVRGTEDTDPPDPILDWWP